MRVSKPRDFRELAAFRVCTGAVRITYRLTIWFPDQAHLDSCWARTEHAVSDGYGHIESRSVKPAAQLRAVEVSRCAE